MPPAAGTPRRRPRSRRFASAYSPRSKSGNTSALTSHAETRKRLARLGADRDDVAPPAPATAAPLRSPDRRRARTSRPAPRRSRPASVNVAVPSSHEVELLVTRRVLVVVGNRPRALRGRPRVDPEGRDPEVPADRDPVGPRGGALDLVETYGLERAVAHSSSLDGRTRTDDDEQVSDFKSDTWWAHRAGAERNLAEARYQRATNR